LLKNGAIQRNTAQTGSLDASSEKQSAQHRETLSKKSLGNYKSAALPTELCRHFARGNATFSSNFRHHCIRDFLWDASWPHGARGKEQNEVKNIVSASRSTAEQHAAPTVFAVTASLVSCCGNYSGICASKKK
jgi:hypothetical protein